MIGLRSDKKESKSEMTPLLLGTEKEFCITTIVFKRNWWSNPPSNIKLRWALVQHQCQQISLLCSFKFLIGICHGTQLTNPSHKSQLIGAINDYSLYGKRMAKVADCLEFEVKWGRQVCRSINRGARVVNLGSCMCRAHCAPLPSPPPYHSAPY